MPPLRIYLDTSVIGGAFDEEFAEDTDALVQLIRKEVTLAVVSELVETELESAPPRVQKLLSELYELGAERLELSSEARELAGAYLAAKVVSSNYLTDALHIALATLAKVDVLVS
jgi:predicted nucleic acid-binding protein